MRFLCKWDRNVNKARQYKNIGQNIPRKTADLNGKQISIASVVWFWTEFSNEREQTTENWKNPVIRDETFPFEFYLSSEGRMETWKRIKRRGQPRIRNERATFSPPFPWAVSRGKSLETHLFSPSLPSSIMPRDENLLAPTLVAGRTLPHIRQMPQVQRGTKGKSIRLDLNRV